MSALNNIGSDWIIQEMENLTDEVIHVLPSKYNENNRYIPKSVSSISGYLRYEVNPYMREIVDCCDIDSPVRELSLKKGVQITFTTMLESIILYFMGHVKTLPIMYMTADKELADSRIENNIIPMLNESHMSHIIRSSDIGNTRKTGKTSKHLQFEGGGYLVPFGAKNADKMRAYSMCVMLKDEIDAWPTTVGKDGDPDKLSDARCRGYWLRRKIFRGSTPLIKGISKIESAYLEGDQRKYMVLCKKCAFPQFLQWKTYNKKTGIRGGFKWDMKDGILVEESVRYCCSQCGEPHFEYDKEKLFSEKHGAHWKPTAKPKVKNIRSYHLPAMYSPIGMTPWSALVVDYINCYDFKAKKVKDIGKYQVFVNNVLAEPFEIMGSKVRFVQVSAHRLAVYRLGQIPNIYAVKYSGSPILLLTCQVDVHKSFLAVTVMGWCQSSICYVIDYWKFETEKDEDDCSEITSPVWQRLRDLIEEKKYKADDNKEYIIARTYIDAGYANDTVVSFCNDYTSGVYPILGRQRPDKNQKIKEFSDFKTQSGTIGFKIVVDHYKDRLAPVLRRNWIEESGIQKAYHFNAPVDISDKQLKELTVEKRVEKKNEKGITTYEWYRPGNARNELWDLLIYGHAGIEIIAWEICIEYFELEEIDWRKFWKYIESEKPYFIES
jgi:phage terminase large subunit GpA-like protein